MEIRFRRDTSFRKQLFVPDSFAHPAKMDSQLLSWIVEHYSKEGELILDPMAGSGTLMIACTMGRNVLLLELEDKFCKMMRDNWEKVRQMPQLGCEMGSCEIIQGDARDLSGLFDKIITSPPFANSVNVSDSNQEARAERLKKAGYDPKEYMGGTGRNLQQDWSYHPVDKIITSPPYAIPATGTGESQEQFDKRLERIKKSGSGWYRPRPTGVFGVKDYGQANGQIGNLPYGQIDKIVTSPPYEEAMGSKHHSPRADKMMAEGAQGMSYTEIGNNDNIGNLKSEYYLEAMLQVYQQCHKVLKDGGLMILVLKNFIRNKQVIRLDLDTIKICEEAGFSLLERHYRKLPSQSFWRILYHRQYPSVPIIDYEDVLVFEKANAQT